MQTHYLKAVEPIRELILQDEFGHIPEIKLKQYSDLGRLSADIKTFAVVITPTENEAELISSVFDTIGDYTQDSANVQFLQDLDITAKSFAAAVESGYCTINQNITPTVNNLRNTIEERYITLMKREKAEQLISPDIEPTENDYTFLNWGMLNSQYNQHEIVENACANANTKAGVSALNLAYVVKKLNFSNSMSEIKLPAELNTVLVSRLVAAFSNADFVEKDIQSVWNILTNKSSYSSFCVKTQAKLENIKSVVNNCIEMVVKTTNLRKVLAECKSLVASDLNPDTLQAFSDNIDAVSKTVYGMQYWLLVNKELKFKNKLILTSSVINRENYDEFVRGGRTITDIHNHLKAFHLNTTIPQGGISVQTVLDSDSKSKLEQANNKLRTNENYLKSKSLISAYDFAITRFVRDQAVLETFPKLKEPAMVTKFITLAKNRASLLAGSIDKVDTIIYDLLIDTFHKDTSISTLYNHLGSGFNNLVASSTEDITDDNILESQCMSTADFLIDYLFNKLVV